jgi:predicted nucleic acid-binding protein
MTLVLNATPLIYLTRAGFSWIFEAAGEPMFSAPEVYFEVVTRGKELDKPDIRVLEALFQNGIIEVRAPKRAVLRKIQKIVAETIGAPLHAGEAEVLALAKELEGTAIIDEKPAREAGGVLGIEVRGSAYLVGLMMRRKKLKLGEAVQAIDKMISGGWRISTEDYIKIVEELKKW